MKVQVGSLCILLDEDWFVLKTYRVSSVNAKMVEIVSAEKFLDQSGSKSVEMDKLFVSPFSFMAILGSSYEISLSRFIADLASSFFREESRVEIDLLIEKLKSHPKLSAVSVDEIRAYLKCLVANKYFKVWCDKRAKERKVFLEPSDHARSAEKQRAFSGTLGSELSHLSERIRLLIQHTGSVGAYRETLLRGLLKRSIPERYHVATGFIYGCSRQVDILIYDRIDYSPLFREDDLVVVPAAAVRAAIEVKTNLTKAELKDSIFLIQELSNLDSGFPPIFKGVFAFESNISDDVLKEALKVYKFEPLSFEDCSDCIIISEPHHHVTSICVLNKVAGHVFYEKDTKTQQYIPVLYCCSSATDLKFQAAFFLDSLISHLKTGTIKEDMPHRILTELGADTIFTRIGALTDSSWGAYFREENGIGDDGLAEVEELERSIEMFNKWFYGLN